MPLTPPPGFSSGKITSSGISIYAALVASDGSFNWPKTARFVILIITGSVTMHDGKHTSVDPLPAGSYALPTSGTDNQQGIYLDNMIVSGGGTVTALMWT